MAIMIVREGIDPGETPNLDPPRKILIGKLCGCEGPAVEDCDEPDRSKRTAVNAGYASRRDTCRSEECGVSHKAESRQESGALHAKV